MKKAVFLFISLIVLASNALAEEVDNSLVDKKEVSLVKCDGAVSSWYEVDDEVKIIRLLAYDPENGELNTQIDEYACSLLTNAKKIEILLDEEALDKDKYNRELAWIYVDGELLQEKLIANGYGQVNYVTGNYLYLTDLCEVQKEAIMARKGIWNYPDIEESYCKSGININNQTDEIEEESTSQKKYNMQDLYYLLFVDSGIILLVLLLIKRG